MRHSQRGVTLIGWIILLVPVAICVIAVIRLTPIYLNYMSVDKYMNLVASENKEGGSSTSAQSLRDSLEKHFNVGYIEHPDVKEIDIHRLGTSWVMIADYEDTAPLFGNVSLLVQFHKETEVK
jgi:Domain of unknown function (DUF4845)